MPARNGAGRPRTPREVKRKRGTLRPARDGGAMITVLPSVERAPQPRQQSGLDMLQEALDGGAKTWIGPTDLAAMEIARQVWEDRERARLLWIAQLAPAPESDKIAWHDEKLFNAYAKLTERLIQCLSALGLDPTARARLGIAEVKRQTTLDRLQDKRATRKAGRHAG